LEIALTREAQSVDATLAQEDMRLDARVVRRAARVEVRRLRASAAGGELSGAGHLDLREALPFRAGLAFNRFNPAAFGDYPEGSISGSASLDGRLGGAREIQAHWAVADSTLNGLALESRGRARFSTHRVAQADIDSKLGQTRASARGAFGRPGDELVWTLNAPRLAEIDPRLEGKIRASGVLSGSWQEPQGRLDAIGEALRVGGGPLLQTASARLSGSLARHEAAIALRGVDLDLEVAVRGGWSGHGWAGELRSAVNRGEYPLRLAAPAALRFARDSFELGRLDARLARVARRIPPAAGALADPRPRGDPAGGRRPRPGRRVVDRRRAAGRRL